MQSICITMCDVSRASSSGTEARSSASEQTSSEADGFSVYSGEDINVTFVEPSRNDGVEFHKPLSGPSVNVRQQRCSSRGRRSSSGSTTSSILENDVEGGYEADSDTHAASRRPSAHRVQAKSRHASRRVHYLVERVEPIIEVLAPMTPEELAYLKAHTNIPIPAHYEHLLPKDAGEASGTPSTASAPASEILSNRAGCGGVGCTQPVATLQSQHLLAEREQQPQPDSGCGSDIADEYSSLRVQPVNFTDNGEPVYAEDSPMAAVSSALGFTLPASPAHFATIDLDDHLDPCHLQDFPQTPNLRPWLAVACGEPSPMVLASPTAPLLLHAPRPRLVHMPRLC